MSDIKFKVERIGQNDYSQFDWGHRSEILPREAFGKNCRVFVTCIDPDCSTCFEKHEHRKEVFSFISGYGEVLFNDEKPFVNLKNIETKRVFAESIFCTKKGMWHKITNLSLDEPLLITEVWVGKKIVESDVEIKNLKIKK